MNRLFFFALALVVFSTPSVANDDEVDGGQAFKAFQQWIHTGELVAHCEVALSEGPSVDGWADSARICGLFTLSTYMSAKFIHEYLDVSLERIVDLDRPSFKAFQKAMVDIAFNDFAGCLDQYMWPDTRLIRGWIDHLTEHPEDQKMSPSVSLIFSMGKLYDGCR
jgi:hypothetical protein